MQALGINKTERFIRLCVLTLISLLNIIGCSSEADPELTKKILVTNFDLQEDGLGSYCTCVAENTSDTTFRSVRIYVENLDKNGVITDQETARLDEMRPHQKYKFKMPIDSDSVASFRVKSIEAYE